VARYVGSSGAAYPVSGIDSRLGMFASSISRMKTPPTTDRAWNPDCFASAVWYQSVMGTRLGVSLTNRSIAFSSASRWSRFGIITAVQISQSSFV